MTVLVIVESPTKAKTIQKYLGPGYEVRASVGHIRDLPEKSLGIDLATFIAEYVVMAGKSKVVSGLRVRKAAVPNVLLATDPDREGEAIAWHLAQVLKLKNPQRITYQEVTKKALLAAIENPRGLDMAMINAQQTRRMIDRIVGWLVSQRISELRGQKLSAGRVQSVTVRLVAELCQRVSQFKAVFHFGAEIHFSGPDGVWKAKWQTKTLLQQRNQEYWLDGDFAQRVANLNRFKVIACEEKARSEAPPAPLTTDTMMVEASSSLKLDSAATMAAAQKLFDAGLITYHRTDSPNLSATAFAAITDYCSSSGLPVVPEQRLWDSAELAQEAHEAIRPTSFGTLQAGDDADQQALYQLIWRHAVGSQLESAVWNIRTAHLQALDAVDGVTTIFTAMGKVLVKAGWRSLLQTSSEEDDGQEQDAMKNPVPLLEPGQLLQPSSGHLLQLKTSPPRLYTEGSLIKALKTRGIGRPSTYAAIIKTIKQRDYVRVDKKGNFHVTELGLIVLSSLVNQFSFMQLDFTRKMEDLLDQIARSQIEHIPVIRGFYNRIARELEGVQIQAAQSYPCPDCGHPMFLNPKGKFGPYWSCSGFKEHGCKTMLPDVDGKPGQKKPAGAAPVPTDIDCPKCKKGKLERRTRLAEPGVKGYDFFGCNRYSKGCKFVCNVVNGEPQLGDSPATGVGQ
ncbi:MAG: type I DNA topoisomerase [Ectopseudomonas guguanensis]|uniref:type I DNA topoisomerase n=1 Tax=Ectopseudomonas guguanensis TaxID=1198456 RepID=UPI00391B9058